MRKHLLFSVMLSLCAMGGMMVYPTPAIATVAQSPAIKVRGQVIDEQGEPLTGATVRIKGGQGGTITDVDGNFQLEVAGNAILSISYVGYKEREVASVSVASDLLVTLLLFMLSMVSPWVLPSAISLQTILKPSKF